MDNVTQELVYPPGGPRPSLVPNSYVKPPPPYHKSFTLLSCFPFELRLKIWLHTLPAYRVLKISYSPTHQAYISNVPPPLTLSISREARAVAQKAYTYLWIGPRTYPLVPYAPMTDVLYVSGLAPILAMHLPDLLYHLSTAPSRHAIGALALDLRVWSQACEAGLLGALARLRGLRQLKIVVEFGRDFGGEVAFLEAPEWRGDLKGVAERAGTEFNEERNRVRGRIGTEKEMDDRARGDHVEVTCVLLTKGGEQA